MILREGPQDSLACQGDVQDDAAAIGGVVLAMDQPCFLTAFAEFDDGVMAEP
jgi:hypothetical protein